MARATKNSRLPAPVSHCGSFGVPATPVRVTRAVPPGVPSVAQTSGPWEPFSVQKRRFPAAVGCRPPVAGASWNRCVPAAVPSVRQRSQPEPSQPVNQKAPAKKA